MQPDPDPDRSPSFARPVLVVGSHLCMHLHRSLQGFVGTVHKQRHHPIAIVLIHKAAILLDDRPDPPKIGIQKIEVVVRRHLLRQGGVVADIGKHDRHLVFHLVAELHFGGTGLAQAADEFVGHKAAKGHVDAGQFAVECLLGFEFFLLGFAHFIAQTQRKNEDFGQDGQGKHKKRVDCVHNIVDHHGEESHKKHHHRARNEVFANSRSRAPHHHKKDGQQKHQQQVIQQNKVKYPGKVTHIPAIHQP